MACPNGSAALLLPWTNNSVSAIGNSLARGIAFAVGSPAQSFSLTPSTFSDNVFINNAAECGGTTNNSCIGQLGGVYDSSASTTFSELSYADWQGSRETIELESASSYIFFDDAVGLKATANKFASFPMLTNGSKDTSASPFPMNEPGTKATLPLGQNSAFLSRMVDAGLASSTAYGVWVGSVSEESPQDGLVVIGGYDKTRLKGASTTFPMFSDCPTCAVMTAITYDVGDKSTTLFSDATTSLIVRLDPYSTDIQLSASMLQNLCGAETDAFWNSTSRRFEFPATKFPVGTITITISDMGTPAGDASKPSVPSYKTTIPASELYYRPRAYSSAGVLEVTNDTVYNMAVTNQTGSATFGVLGLPFFTQNYLIGEPEKKVFQLAPAVTTPADSKGADADVKHVCRVFPGTKQKSQAGPIAGAVVGSIVGTLLLVALFWYIRRRRRRVAEIEPPIPESETTTANSSHPMRVRMAVVDSSKSRSLELPRQGHESSPMTLSDGTVFPSPASHGKGSIRSGREDPRRGLVHDILRTRDEDNDGRLLSERPMGLVETIHSKVSLPRIGAEHNVP